MKVPNHKSRLIAPVESPRINASSNRLGSRPSNLNADTLRIELRTIRRVRSSTAISDVQGNDLGSDNVFASLQTRRDLDVPGVVVGDELVGRPEALVVGAVVDPSALSNLDKLQLRRVIIIRCDVVDDGSVMGDWPTGSLPPFYAEGGSSGEWGADVGVRATFGTDNLGLIGIDGVQRVASEVGGIPIVK